MARLRANFLTGSLTNNPLTSAATQIAAAELSKAPVVTAPNILPISLDPDGLNGAPEIVWVTDHASLATVATVLREQEGTFAREHPAGTPWGNNLTAVDINELYAAVGTIPNYLPLAGGVLTGPLTLFGAPTADLHAATKAYVDSKIAAGGYLALSGGTMTGFLTLHADPSANMHAATRQYVENRAYAWATQQASTIYHDDRYYLKHEVYTVAQSENRMAAWAGTASQPGHGHDYLWLGGGTVTGYLYCVGFWGNGLGVNAEWPYGGASNGSLRYLGVGNWIYQNNGSSSVKEKVYVQDIDLDKSLFSRLDPIWFHYSAKHKYRKKWDPEVWDREINPQDVGRMGFAYEQMLEIAPQWTYITEAGMECIGWDAMVPDFIAYATAAIRELRSRVAVLEGI
jgi:hypothetical protein